MSLSRYSIEVRGVTDEILAYFEGPLRPIAERIVKNHRSDIFSMNENDRVAAIAFLKKTPSQRDRAVKTVDENTALLLLRARYLGLQASRLLNLAADFEYVPGTGYRAAAAWAANRVSNLNLEPTVAEILPPRSGLRRPF